MRLGEESFGKSLEVSGVLPLVLMNTASEYVPVFNGRKYFVVVPLFFNVIAWLVQNIEI